MNDFFPDVITEFLAIAFHNILYFASVYPQTIFESRKKYNIVVFQCVHPDVNQYLDLCLKNIEECLKNNQLERVEFVITDNNYQPILNFVFDFEKLSHYNETHDPYLTQCEQYFRSFCLKLIFLTEQVFRTLPVDTSFTVYLHTNESAAVALATNPDLEEFPMIEVEKDTKESDRIIPIRRFRVRKYNINTYVEFTILEDP